MYLVLYNVHEFIYKPLTYLFTYCCSLIELINIISPFQTEGLK